MKTVKQIKIAISLLLTVFALTTVLVGVSYGDVIELENYYNVKGSFNDERYSFGQVIPMIREARDEITVMFSQDGEGENSVNHRVKTLALDEIYNGDGACTSAAECC